MRKPRTFTFKPHKLPPHVPFLAFSMLHLCFSCLRLSNRSFKQLIGGLENVSNKVYESEEVKAK